MGVHGGCLTCFFTMQVVALQETNPLSLEDEMPLSGHGLSPAELVAR